MKRVSSDPAPRFPPGRSPGAGRVILLHRHTGLDDLVVGTVDAGRRSAALEEVVGPLLNTLALRVRLEGEPSFREVLRRVRAVCLSAYAHAELPFVKLVETLNRKSSPWPVLT